MKKFLVLFFILSPFMLQSQSDNSRPRGKVGFKFETSGIKSIWATVGTRPYFIYEVGHNFPKDNSVKHNYYDKKLLDNWSHKRIDNIYRNLYWSTGVGYRIKNFGFHGAICMMRINTYYQYYDETLLFSPNGKYSFLGETGGFISFKAGGTYQRKKFIFATDFNVKTKELSLGLGYDFSKRGIFINKKNGNKFH